MKVEKEGLGEEFANEVKNKIILRPTKTEIDKQYKDLIQEEKPHMLLFYYLGHGFIKGDEKSANAMAPSDVF